MKDDPNNPIAVTYSGIAIAYNEVSDNWRFELRGRSRSATSLSKAKEAIDKEPVEKRKQTFPRFDAYIFNSYEDARIVTVTGVGEQGWGGQQTFWVDNKGKRSKESASSLYPVNEKNTAIAKELARIKKEINRLGGDSDAQMKKLEKITIPKELE